MKPPYIHVDNLIRLSLVLGLTRKTSKQGITINSDITAARPWATETLIHYVPWKTVLSDYLVHNVILPSDSALNVFAIDLFLVLTLIPFLSLTENTFIKLVYLFFSNLIFDIFVCFSFIVYSFIWCSDVSQVCLNLFSRAKYIIIDHWFLVTLLSTLCHITCCLRKGLFLFRTVSAITIVLVILFYDLYPSRPWYSHKLIISIIHYSLLSYKHVMG